MSTDLTASSIVDVTIVIVTHNREIYLERLLNSLLTMTRVPRSIIVVNNASSDNTQQLLEEHAAKWPPNVFINLPQQQNLGGSGGFAAGVARAMDTDSNWLWLMDDDVEALPDGLEKLMGWSGRFNCIHGQRLNLDGSHFFFQPHFYEWLGVPLIWFRKLAGSQAHRQINVGCFEGMLVHKSVVSRVGLPDARYFQTWDDAMYGWQISLFTPVVLVNEYILRRTRSQRQISLGVRHLNDASDNFRFHIMRNRAFVAQLLAKQKKYNRVGFALGTFLVFTKEFVRLTLVERRIRGVFHLYRGWQMSRRLMNEQGGRFIGRAGDRKAYENSLL